ncbi:MAG: ATP-binding protein [Planctomycetota bacterium]
MASPEWADIPRQSDTPRERGVWLFGPTEIEKLVDRLSGAVHSQTQLIHELEDARTELAQRNAEVEAERRRAEQANDTLATFLRALGHDLRAPLVAVDIGLELAELDARARDAELADRIADIRRTSRHGLGLIDDLFELIRSQAGQWRVERLPTALRELLADVRAVVAPAAHAKGLHFETRWHGGDALADEIVDTDPVRLRQALVNLVANAVKFSGQGTVAIEVEREGGRLRFRVVDEGPGIDPAILGSLFEPFVQGGDRSRGGAGLGLAIARRCARLLGGDVVAANRPEGGAVFTLEVDAPRAELAAASAAPPAPRHAGGSEGTVRRALVVEDAPDAARLVLHHLGALGVEATVAGSLAEARAALASGQFDLVISDNELPDGSGLELARTPGLPPLVISSANCAVPADLPVHAVLPKPIARVDLAETIASVAARRPMPRAARATIDAPRAA